MALSILNIKRLKQSSAGINVAALIFSNHVGVLYHKRFWLKFLLNSALN